MCRHDLARRVHGEDQRALDYLCSREDVDSERVGCAGLSGGGLRTVYLGGIDARIRCACCVGMMSTWRDYLLDKCHTHTWMIYIPLLPRDLTTRRYWPCVRRCRRWFRTTNKIPCSRCRDAASRQDDGQDFSQSRCGGSLSLYVLSWSP